MPRILDPDDFWSFDLDERQEKYLLDTLRYVQWDMANYTILPEKPNDWYINGIYVSTPLIKEILKRKKYRGKDKNMLNELRHIYPSVKEYIKNE